MDTALIIIIAAVVVLALVLLARRGWERGLEARREKAGELRVEATQSEERAKRAEIQAEREREAAEARTTRADRIDPDAEGERPGLFARFRRDRDGDEEHAEDEEYASR